MRYYVRSLRIRQLSEERISTRTCARLRCLRFRMFRLSGILASRGRFRVDRGNARHRRVLGRLPPHRLRGRWLNRSNKERRSLGLGRIGLPFEWLPRPEPSAPALGLAHRPKESRPAGASPFTSSREVPQRVAETATTGYRGSHVRAAVARSAPDILIGRWAKRQTISTSAAFRLLGHTQKLVSGWFPQTIKQQEESLSLRFVPCLKLSLALRGKGFAIRKRRHDRVSQHRAGGVLRGRLADSAYRSLTCYGIRETINAEHCYGALMASARTDPQKAEKRQSFGSEIR